MCLRIKSIIFSAAVLLLFLSFTPVLAGPFINDHFDGAILNETVWEVSTVNVSSWSSKVLSDSKIIVDDITPFPNNISQSRIQLTQTFDGLDNFKFDFDFSWDSGGLVSSEQRVTLYLYGSEAGQDVLVAKAGYVDPAPTQFGAKMGKAGTDSTLLYNLPNSGSASVDIIRTGDQIDILWDNVLLISGSSSVDVTKAVLEFGYDYEHLTINPNITFGTVSVDLVADPVPEPSTMVLLIVGLTGLYRLRRAF